MKTSKNNGCCLFNAAKLKSREKEISSSFKESQALMHF